MQVPFHPAIAHVPLVLTLVLPILLIVFAVMIKKHKMHPHAWLIMIGLQLAVVVTGYVALETGETEEHTVAKIVSKQYIHEHEEAAEIFTGSAVITLVLSIAAFFVRKEIGFPLKLAIAGLTVVSTFLGYRAAHLGGEIAYLHGGASAYAETRVETLLPPPTKNASESNENESLKPDENDYGNGDEIPESLEDLKQEDEL
jgi:uncharacterized membrane protein